MDWLLNWLWQGLALALLVRLVIYRLPATSASARFATWWVALAGILAMPSLPWLLEPGGGSGAFSAAVDAAADPQPTGLQLPAPPDWLVSMAISVWLGGVAIKLARLALAARHVDAIKSRCEALPRALAGHVRQAVKTTQRRRAVTVSVTDDLGVPALLGLHRLTIVVPRRLVERLSCADVELVVRHELAHAERGDDWSRLLQRVVEAFYCFHPAVWLIGHRLDEERELACDDRVVLAAQGQRRAYAACLTRVAELCAGTSTPLVTLAAIGRQSQIARRVERLLATPSDAGKRRSPMATVEGSVLVAAGLIACALVPPVLTIAAKPSMSIAPILEARSVARGELAADTATRFHVPVIGERSRAARGEPRPGAIVFNRQTDAPAVLRSTRAVADTLTVLTTDALLARRAREPEHQADVQESSARSTLVAAVAVPQHEGPLLTAVTETGVTIRRTDDQPRARLSRAPDDEAAWESFTSAGVVIGGGAKRAGVATGRFFSRLGVNIARVF